MKSRIFLRIFVEVQAEDAASEIAKAIATIASRFSEIKDQSISKYWKINEYYEIFLNLCPKNQLETDYKGLLSELGSGWESSGDFESIWNYGEDRVFIDNSVRWAHLEKVDL